MKLIGSLTFNQQPTCEKKRMDKPKSDLFRKEIKGEKNDTGKIRYILGSRKKIQKAFQ